MPNENVEATLVVAVVATIAAAFDPNEKVLFGAVAAMPLPNENCDFGGMGSVLAVAPFVTSLDWSQQAHFDFDASFRLRHAEHSQLLLFCLSAIALNTSSTGLDEGGWTADDDVDGNAPKLNAGFTGSLPPVAFALLEAFGFGSPQQTHLFCACVRRIRKEQI